jgi:hypothetical protein
MYTPNGLYKITIECGELSKHSYVLVDGLAWPKYVFELICKRVLNGDSAKNILIYSEDYTDL